MPDVLGNESLDVLVGRRGVAGADALRAEESFDALEEVRLVRRSSLLSDGPRIEVLRRAAAPFPRDVDRDGVCGGSTVGGGEADLRPVVGRSCVHLDDHEAAQRLRRRPDEPCDVRPGRTGVVDRHDRPRTLRVRTPTTVASVNHAVSVWYASRAQYLLRRQRLADVQTTLIGRWPATGRRPRRADRVARANPSSTSPALGNARSLETDLGDIAVRQPRKPRSRKIDRPRAVRPYIERRAAWKDSAAWAAIWSPSCPSPSSATAVRKAAAIAPV